MKNLQDPLESSLDNLLEGFQIIDREWKYVYLNNTALLQSKYPSKNDLLGFTMMEKFPGIDLTPLYLKMKIVMEKKESQRFENEFTFQDGSLGYFDLHIQPVPQGISILSWDITERKKAEEKNHGYLKRLEDLIFMTSHRVRQPITNILGIAHLLDDSPQSQDDLIRLTRYIKKSALLLDEFTKELIDMMEEINPEGKSTEG